MFNDFKGFDEKDNPIKISVHPTLMISSLGVIEDVKETVTMDFKVGGDLIYVIGLTKDECGGSEFYHVHGEKGGKSPKVDAKNARKLYEKMHNLIKKDIFSSCASVAQGGLLITLAKMSIAGELGADVDFGKVSVREGEGLSVENVEKIFYSETQSRFIISIDPKNKKEFEKEMSEFDISEIGIVNEEGDFVAAYGDEKVINSNVGEMGKVYRERFKDF